MSTLKTDAIEAATGTNTDLSLDGKGTGVPDLGAGFKVGSVAGVPTASIRDDAITTAKINDDAVTLAKMAAGTDGTVLTFDASGNPTAVGPGNDGQVLTSAGAGAQPAFEDAGGGGAWTWIAKSTASASATLVISGMSSTYSTYMITGTDLVVSDDSAVTYCRVGTASGIISDSSYSYHIGECGGTSYAAQASDSGSSTTARVNANTGNATGEGYSFFIQMDGVAGARWCMWRGMQNGVGTGGTNRGGQITGTLNAASAAITQFQIYPSAGTLTSGEMNLYGLATS